MRANLPVRQRVAESVKQLRTARGWSQEELAERAGNTGRHISLIETSKVNATVDVLASIASQFGVDVADLFGDPTIAAAGSLCLIARKDLDRIERILVRAKRRRAARGRGGKA
jgi:transcriptional regulator with XRE-family HTH domain